jgi:hypothetical protein
MAQMWAKILPTCGTSWEGAWQAAVKQIWSEHRLGMVRVSISQDADILKYAG